MSSGLEQLSNECCVVVGPEAVSTRRADSPYVPIVALVDAGSPVQAVLAQAAGADIVLPTADLEIRAHQDSAGLALAMQAARTIAHGRAEQARSARKVGHDLAGALNVIGLAAELGANGTTCPNEAFAHIATLTAQADADAWRTGRTDRSAGRSLSAVDLLETVGRLSTDGNEVVVTSQMEALWVFADERQLERSVAELIGNARRADAEQIWIDISSDGRNAHITVSDDGDGFPAEHKEAIATPRLAHPSSNRQGLGLAGIAEFAADLGGSLTSAEPDSSAWSSAVRLSLPLIDGRSGELAAHVGVIDQATAQADILERVVRHGPLAESLEAIVAAIEHQLPDTVCSVLLLRDRQSLHHGAGAKLPKAYRQAIDGVAIGNGQGSCGTAAFTGRPVVASDVMTDHNWVQFRDVAAEHNLRSCWSTPIVAAEGGEVLGTFAVYKKSTWRPNQAAIKLVSRFTYLAAVAIEHHRLFGAVAESESRFRSAFEGASAGLALVHLDGSLLKVNPALSAMVGESEQELLGSCVLELVDAEGREEVRVALDQLASGQASTLVTQPAIEVPLTARPDGVRIWVSLTTSIVAAAGERNFYVEVRDITARRRHLAEQRAREAAEASNQAKNDFLALVSHELRTPLNAILGFAQVMQLTDLDPDQSSDSIEQIVRAGEHLRDLIHQLLDLSRIEAGQLAVEVEAVDTTKVISEAIELVGPLAMSRNIALHGHRRIAEPHFVLADERCLRQVLINLLGNAVKYTPPQGKVEVNVGSVASGNIRITVRDNGPGIAADSLEELFQPFRRLQPEHSGRSEGTGLGLALTARLMAEMGGAIGVESTLGIGSSFWVEFPPTKVASEPADSGSTPRTLHSKGQAGGVVLYVEDDAASVAVMAAALSSRPSIELRTAETAVGGEAAILKGDIDLVLLDIGLPDRSGWELLHAIRTRAPDLPVILLTAGVDTVSAPRPSTEPRPQHTQLFTKPLDLAEVLHSIDLALGKKQIGS